MIRRRRLVGIIKLKTGWRCEYSLGRQKYMFVIQDNMDKEAVTNIIAGKFKTKPESVRKKFKLEAKG